MNLVSLELQGGSIQNQSPIEGPINVLLVEDNPGDVRLAQEAFERARVRVDLYDVRRGSEALDFLHQRAEHEDAPRPDIALLDLNLPGMNGTEFLEEIDETPELRLIPTIVLTSSRTEEDVVRSYAKHANAYLTKPKDVDEFVQLARCIGEFWVEEVELPPVDG